MYLFLTQRHASFTASENGQLISINAMRNWDMQLTKRCMFLFSHLMFHDMFFLL
jgi:hypothetical protein